MYQRQLKVTLIKAKRALILLVAIVFFSSGIATLTSSGGSVLAASITQRSLTISTAQVNATASYTFSFVPGTTAAIQGIKFLACTTPLGTCTAPAGLSLNSAAGGTLTGSWTNATAFTPDHTGANDCIASANILCAKRTQASNETGTSPRGVNFTTITNPSGSSCTTANCTFFVRVTTYSVNTYLAGNIVDTGTVAASTTQSLTVSAIIQEQLSFCIGATSVNDATSTVPLCSAISGTSLSLGTLNSSNIAISPVAATYNGDGNNGLAELSTNASTGATVAYDSIQQAGTNHLGTLRVAGATCQASAVNYDQCINAIGTSHATITAGSEAFGMTVAGINCSQVTAYTCSFASGTTDLVRDPQYNCNGTNTYPTSDSSDISGTSTCSYAWDETGAPDTIASASTVVGNEALILKFAATPNSVTPTGSYTAKADFVATPTF
jgi:hypothetical protein